MNKYIKCPRCQIEESFDKKLKVCSNKDCELFYSTDNHEFIDFTLKSLICKILYLRPRNIYYYIKNRFFKRYDLVRTGLSKSQWCDVDHRMFLAIMNLVESYVVNEEGIYYCDSDEEDNKDLKYCIKRQNKYKKKISDLYVDYKVTYPKMKRELEAILMDNNRLNTEYHEAESAIYKYENSLMKRAIDLRDKMWT